jgi:hypothetical protein
VGLKMAVVVVLVVVVVERAGALKDFGDEVDATRVTSQHRDPQWATDFIRAYKTPPFGF